MSDWFDESNVQVELPPCELSRLEDLHNVIEKALSNKSVYDIISLGIEKEDYVSKLLDIFHVCEDLDNAEGLKFLHKIFTGLLLLNKNDLLTVCCCVCTFYINCWPQSHTCRLRVCTCTVYPVYNEHHCGNSLWLTCY